jgi:hypothetical protein
MDDDEVPRLQAYQHKGGFKAWCRWCDTYHHWRGVGRQPGKCPAYTPNAAQVELIDAGPWSPMKVTRYSNRKV